MQQNIPGVDFRFLSTLSLRRATNKNAAMGKPTLISIHALLAESDGIVPSVRAFRLTISIHALLAESDARRRETVRATATFLSTLSLRRATKIPQQIASTPTYFYPRSPCGERPPDISGSRQWQSISIHALLAESDLAVPDLGKRNIRISIHALLAESDCKHL